MGNHQKIADSKVLIVGMGGLGCPVLQQLCLHGVSKIGLVDADTVSLSNLNRQFLYGINDIGFAKVDVAQKYVDDQFNDIDLTVYNEFLTLENAIEIIEAYDFVFDCTDNFPSRYMISDACVLLKKPLFMGAVNGLEGQVFQFSKLESAFYRDVFPTPPNSRDILTCNQSNVPLELTKKIGTLMVSNFIKHIDSINEYNLFINHQLEKHEMFQFDILPNQKGYENTPKTIDQFLKSNYQIQCFGNTTITWQEIDLDNLDICILDIREKHEGPDLTFNQVLRLTFDEIQNNAYDFSNHNEIYVVCDFGNRSLPIAHYLRSIFPNKMVFSVFGGINDAFSPLNLKQNGS
jgi:adenylyltransferase/sulfurtransferase